MDIQTRKIEFIQAFLSLQSEEAISLFEALLKSDALKDEVHLLEPMSTEELIARITKSEEDFAAKKYKTTADLLTKY